MNEGTPSRAQQRHSLELPVELSYGDQQFQVTSINMSLGGCLLGPVEGIPFGAEVSINFELPDQDKSMDLSGYVCWIDADVGLGIQYGALRATDVWAMQRLFNSLYQ